ncbi:hypothetical protein [Pseudomonas aeruginosa]|uniref:hypothetical protein n=2 Tax=Pseudomonas TaxID=286 RepID=UPI001EEF225D|nr:hypothetical protein [Pseudomonas aeruginosa]MCG7131874.1 hypothetical protein [Pseudomonas aeruginosa]MCG7156848.1 hypothetical protein [Pseudomonas aeruginosa]MCG7169375.1 hypothetical protein [Pseudomonas aeruginosa]MCG7175968.1 hypothetical protein [Pseudomonas aeruginosa]HDP4811130.1 hypothetical protein [Pseudomonas aeruginosa]
MSDFKRIKEIYISFAESVRTSFDENNFAEIETIDTLRVRYWYEELRMRTGLETALDMEYYFEKESFKRNAKGAVAWYRNKWSRYVNGQHVPKGKTLRRVEAREHGSTRELYLPLWEVLDVSNTRVMQDDSFLRRLDPEIQAAIWVRSSSGMLTYYGRADITQVLLEKLERRASLDALACLTWLLRESSMLGDSENALKISRSLYNVLLMLSIELHARKTGLPLLGLFIRDILPLGLEPHLKMWMVENDFMQASAHLNLLVYNTEHGYKRSLSWPQRVKVMQRLLKGDFGLDVQFAMAPQFDLNDETNTPAVVVKNYWRATRLREWGWEQIANGRCEKFPPSELML